MNTGLSRSFGFDEISIFEEGDDDDEFSRGGVGTNLFVFELLFEVTDRLLRVVAVEFLFERFVELLLLRRFFRSDFSFVVKLFFILVSIFFHERDRFCL